MVTPPGWASVIPQTMRGFSHSVVVTEIVLFLHLRLVQSRLVSRLVPLKEATLHHSTT